MRQKLGPTCPKCGSDESSVFDSRPNAAGRIWRRRECPNGHRYTTHEAVVGVDDEPNTLRSVARSWTTRACPVWLDAHRAVHAAWLLHGIADAMDRAIDDERGRTPRRSA